MKKGLKIIMILIMLFGIGFSFANFISTPVSAIRPDALYVQAVHDCWDRYQVDCYYIGWIY